MKNKKTFFTGLLKSLKNLLFPENITCDICKKETQNKKELCESCFARLPFVKTPCQKCGCDIKNGLYCIRCKSYDFNFDYNIAVCRYNNFVKNIIFRFKNGDKYLYKFISLLMTNKIKEQKAQFDTIAYVPITKKVLRERGYNQSELLAKNISENLKLPLFTGLIKTKETLFQKNCLAKNRAENVKNSFSVTDKTQIKDKNILLADDIITTGSTLSECALTLLKNGAKNVTTCTFAAVEHLIAVD